MLAMLMLNRMTTQRRSLLAKEVMCKKEKKPDTQSVVCRTCLSADNLVAIFYSPGIEKKRTEDLKLATGLEIRPNDGLSQKICTGCVDKMNKALQFRRTSKKAEKSLLNVSLGLQPKKKIISKASGKRPVKINSPKVQKVEQKVAKVEVPEYDSLYDDFRNYDDDLDNGIPKEYDVSIEKDVKLGSYEVKIDKDIKDVPLIDYATGVVKDMPLDDYNDEIDEKPKIKQLLQPARGAGGARGARAPRTRTNIPNAASYTCGTCGKVFRMKATYKAHLRFHTNYCVCEACGKRCRNNNQLQEHKRARHGLGRIHKCAYCEYSSATKEALTIHERRHTGERPYVCDHCGAAFHRRSNLVQHIAIHLPDKNFQCELCPKRLKSRKFLQIHKHNAHTGRRYGYLCPVCAHRFEKPNKCSLCLKREKSKKLLQVHVFKAHREKRYRYVCPVCRDTFTRPGNVRQHLARSHGVARDSQGGIHRYQIHTSGVTEEAPPRTYVYL